MRLVFLRGNTLLGHTFAAALTGDVTVLGPEEVDDAALESLAPDLIVVATFPRKLPDRWLALPRLGAINVHASLLPRHRGAMPEFWAIRCGDAESGVSVHLMTDRFDAGPVLARVTVPIGPRETMASLTEKLCAAGPPVLASVVEAYRRGAPPRPEPQDDARATSAPMVREHHLEVELEDSARSIDRLVRAADPILGPWIHVGGEKIFVRAVLPLSEERPGLELQPGVAFIDDDAARLLTGTGDGLLELVEVDTQREGLIAGHAFAKLRGLATGDRISG